MNPARIEAVALVGAGVFIAYTDKPLTEYARLARDHPVMSKLFAAVLGATLFHLLLED